MSTCYVNGVGVFFLSIKNGSCVARTVGTVELRPWSSPKPQRAQLECTVKGTALVGLTPFPLQTKPEHFVCSCDLEMLQNFRAREKPHFLKHFNGHVAGTWWPLINCFFFFSVCRLHYHVKRLFHTHSTCSVILNNRSGFLSLKPWIYINQWCYIFYLK